MTNREKTLLRILGLAAGTAAALLTLTWVWDLSQAQEGMINDLKRKKTLLETSSQDGTLGTLRGKIAQYESQFWPQGTITALELGQIIRGEAQRQGLGVLGARLRREDPRGAFWEWQLSGRPGAFFQFLDRLEALDHPLLFRSLDLRMEKGTLKIVMEVGYGLPI